MAVGGQARKNGADQNGEEGAAFDQRIARRQFFTLQEVGQDAVFDRTEQRGKAAEQEHGEK